MWQRVGFVESKAAGGTSQQTLSYQFRAEGLQPGTHAFRLRQKDIDGDTEVHGPVRVGGLEDLASGTYFVRLTAGDGSVTKTQALTLVR